MKVLVTGATGVYGRDLTDRLLRAGHEVVAMARRVPAALPPEVRFEAGDVADADAVEGAMAGCDVVAHLAWVVTPLKSEAETRRINIGGTQNVLAAMGRTGCGRLVFSSSVLCYGANPDNPPRFTESDERRPARDYLYGSHKKEVEDLILQSGVEAVIARTAATVGRNIDNLLVDIFAAPAVIGVKGADIRYQFVHQEDVGRFLALACEGGPPGPVNVAPDDLLPLAEIARVLGKPFVELTHEQVMRTIRFMWRHNLADITPGEAAAISYLPKVDTTRMKEVWGFRCAWTTAESVVDLRRAVAGRVAVAKRRIDLPWRLRFPHTRVGTMLAVDSRLVAAGYGREAQRLAADAGTALAWADRPAALPDERLEAALAVLHDELAWAWSVVAVGAALDGRLGDPFDGLAVRLPDGAPIAAANPLAGAPPQGRHAASRALAERTAAALAGALVALVGERARRLVTAGRLDAAGDVAHLA